MNVLHRILAAVVGTAIVGLGGAVPAAADDVRDRQWHLLALDVSNAQLVADGQSVVVAVIDTGVDGRHPDLKGSVLEGVDLFNPGRNGWEDLDGHGTAIAGLIAAHGRALGIAPAAKILPIRNGLDNSLRNISSAIDAARVRGAQIICIAQGSEFSNDEDRQAVERAIRADIVVVAGVGNGPEHTRVIYPAAYPGVMAVAGTGRDGTKADVSVSGREVVIAAPAVDIYSTGITGVGGGYQLATGTSDATAIVAGAAALVRSRFPELSAEEVIHRLTATADDKGPPGRDDDYGYGVLNIVKALTADVPQLGGSAAPTPPAQGGGPSFAVIGGIALVAILAAAGITAVVRRRN